MICFPLGDRQAGKFEVGNDKTVSHVTGNFRAFEGHLAEPI